MMKYAQIPVYSLTILLSASTPGWPAQTVAPIIDNERVTVWDLTIKPGESHNLAKQDFATVNLYLSGDQVRVIDKSGREATITRKVSDVDFEPIGTEKTEQVLGNSPLHVVQVALSNHPSPHYAGNTGYPLAFPRPGSQKVFENDRIIVWSSTWTVGVPTPDHYHDKDVVVAYLGDGTLNSVPVHGKSEATRHITGDIRFNKADRSHHEVLEDGQLSAVIVELK